MLKEVRRDMEEDNNKLTRATGILARYACTVRQWWPLTAADSLSVSLAAAPRRRPFPQLFPLQQTIARRRGNGYLLAHHWHRCLRASSLSPRVALPPPPISTGASKVSPKERTLYAPCTL